MEKITRRLKKDERRKIYCSYSCAYKMSRLQQRLVIQNKIYIHHRSLQFSYFNRYCSKQVGNQTF